MILSSSFGRPDRKMESDLNLNRKTSRVNSLPLESLHVNNCSRIVVTSALLSVNASCFSLVAGTGSSRTPTFKAHDTWQTEVEGKKKMGLVERSGDGLVVRVTNDESHTVYICILFLQLDGSIVALYPKRQVCMHVCMYVYMSGPHVWIAFVGRGHGGAGRGHHGDGSGTCSLTAH